MLSTPISASPTRLLVRLSAVLEILDAQCFDFRQLNLKLRIGVQLGWLLDRLQRQVFIYRPNTFVEQLDHSTA